MPISYKVAFVKEKIPVVGISTLRSKIDFIINKFGIDSQEYKYILPTIKSRAKQERMSVNVLIGIEPPKQDDTKTKPKKQYGKPVPTFNHLIRTEKYRKIFSSVRGASVVWEYMWSYIIRKEMDGDIYDIYNNYYKKDKLACSVSIRKLSKECFVGINTIKKTIKLFVDNKIIYKNEAPSSKTQRDKHYTRQYIYILGKVVDKKEVCYRNTVCMGGSKKDTVAGSKKDT